MCRNKRLIAGVLLTILGVFGVQTHAQSLTDYLAECERKYGSDADLVNGEKYYYPYSRSEGDPFFDSQAQASRIRVREKEFDGQMLRYDIYNQQLVLDYQDIYGGTSSLVLRNEWVESFSFGSFLFKKMEGPEGEMAYFQVIEDSTISCVYRWSKKYQLNLNSGVQNYYFTDPVRESFLVMDNHFIQFRNNRSFLKAFGKKQQKTIKLFMRQSKLKVNKSPEPQMRHLIEYCNSLPHEDS